MSEGPEESGMHVRRQVLGNAHVEDRVRGRHAAVNGRLEELGREALGPPLSGEPASRAAESGS